MSEDLAVIRDALNEFQKVQKRMLTAKEENAIRTYAELKEDYLAIKALLSVSGVNLADIDKIKE